MRGNLCQVVKAAPPANPAATAQTTCYGWQDPACDNTVRVACYSPGGTAIQCCGHGLLASGWRWLQDCHGPLMLEMPGCSAQVRREGELIWASLPRLSPQPCTPPDWLQGCFPEPPCAAALVGDDNGYLVAEWREAFNLRLLPRPRDLGDHTSRALVATQWQGRDPTTGRQRVAVRYFAPQYGVPEDAATGSAARVVADYWQLARGADALVIHQQSPEGGLLYSRLDSTTVHLGGRVVLARASGGATEHV